MAECWTSVDGESFISIVREATTRGQTTVSMDGVYKWSATDSRQHIASLIDILDILIH